MSTSNKGNDNFPGEELSEIPHIQLPMNTHISISIVNDEEMQKLNKQFRDKDYPTDVLSFEIKEDIENGGHYLGDIVVNSEQAERQAPQYGNSYEEEIAELVAHGVLHLLGIHHDGDDH